LALGLRIVTVDGGNEAASQQVRGVG
jgi:hypothetical protein